MISNFENGEEVRYPVIFLEGTVSHEGLSIAGGMEQCATVRQRKFKALVEVRQGKNVLRLTSGDETLEITIRFRPATTGYRVQPVLLTSSDQPFSYPGTHGPTTARAGMKLSTAMKLYQCYTAEEMRKHGFGRKTFHMSMDKDNNAQVLSIRTKETTAQLEPLSDDQAYKRIFAALPKDPKIKYVVVSKFASGRGGGNLAVSMLQNMAYWANSTADVMPAMQNPTRSGLPFERWKISMIGPSIHEVGHTFGLPHPGSFKLAGDWPAGDDDRHHYIMAGWVTSLPFFFIFSDNEQAVVPTWGDQTRFLNFSRWFAPDPAPGNLDAPNPTIEIKNDTVALASPCGLGAVIWVFKEGKAVHAITDLSVEKKRRYEIGVDTLKRSYGTPAATVLSVHVIDLNGNYASWRDNEIDD